MGYKKSSGIQRIYDPKEYEKYITPEKCEDFSNGQYFKAYQHQVHQIFEDFRLNPEPLHENDKRDKRRFNENIQKSEPDPLWNRLSKLSCDERMKLRAEFARIDYMVGKEELVAKRGGRISVEFTGLRRKTI